MSDDLVILELLEFFDIVLVLKILQASALLYYVCVTKPLYIPICHSFFLGLLYLFQDGVN